MRPGPDNRWFFVHVMKTGGNTVRELLNRNLDRRHLYPNPSDQPRTRAKVHLPFLRDLPAERLDEIHVFTVHMPWCATQLLPYPTSTMTVLREPVERTVSWLRQRQRLHEPGTPFEVLYDDPARLAYADEHQTRMFSAELDDGLEAFTDPLPVDERRLELAKQRLDATDIVGFQDDMEGFFATVCDRLGLDVRDAPARNVAEGSVEISPSLRQRIIDDNRYDLALYDYARRTRG